MKFFKIHRRTKYPVVCNIPHASTRVPSSFRASYWIGFEELNMFAKSMADLYSDSLYDNTIKKYGGIVSDVSRVLVDTERFREDSREPMAKVGMGVLYTKSEDGKPIRKISSAERQILLKNVYDSYHIELEKLVKERIFKFGKCLIIDCHTFPSKPRPFETDRKKNRPDICLGADLFHTPKSLLKELQENFKKNSFTVKINSPFVGSMVPLPYYKKNKNVESVMIELNRKLYMNESSFEKNSDFEIVRQKINNIVQRVIEKHV